MRSRRALELCISGPLSYIELSSKESELARVGMLSIEPRSGGCIGLLKQFVHVFINGWNHEHQR